MGLLADLCFKFQTHPEVLATEALALLLGDNALTDALTRFLSVQLAMDAASLIGLKFKSQDSTKEGRPDLVAVAPDGRVRLIIELKFWAELTSNQPTGYLDRLAGIESGILLFVAPANRHEILWSELIRKIVSTGRVYKDMREPGSEWRAVSVGDTRLALISWRSVLSVLADAANVHGGGRSSDIQQLRDLTDRMDSEAFLPVSQEDLSPRLGLRVWQYNEIIDDVIATLSADNTCSKSRRSGGTGYYGASVLLRNHWLYVEISYWHWSQYAATPFWLVYASSTESRAEWPVLNAALASLANEVPPRLLQGRHGEPPMIPLHVPQGAEKHQVVAALCDQVRDVARRLPTGVNAPPEPVANSGTSV